MGALQTLALAGALAALAALGDDNRLTEEERKAGWLLLFDGKEASDWIRSQDGSAVTDKVIEGGALTPRNQPAPLLVYGKKQFGDFVLRCDVKMGEPHANSGIFFRVADLKNPIETGLEVQVLDPEQAKKHSPYWSFGAVYDLASPAKNVLKGPGEWDAIELRCEGPHVTVAVNGEVVTRLNCDEFVERGRRPDGTPHKFKGAIKDFARSGFIGLQNGWEGKSWFKNLRLLELKTR
jgi:hypothetical protein